MNYSVVFMVRFHIKMHSMKSNDIISLQNNPQILQFENK